MKTGYIITSVIVSLLWCLLGNMLYQIKISESLKRKYNILGTGTGVIVDILCILIIHISTNVLLDLIPYVCAILDFYGIIHFE